MRLAYSSFVSVLVLVWGALSATGCGAKTSDGGGTDSNTHWLGRCTADADCEGELSCVCGACTSECASSSSCESLDEGALCLDVQCNESEQAVCTLGCSTESDCPSGTNCEGGACVPRLAEVSSSDDPDAGGPDAGGPPSEPSTYEPCAGKSCGDDCRQCDPDGEEFCAESAEPHYCRADGTCGDPDPQCPAVPDGPCDPTLFEDTGNDCLLYSWIWDGSACTEVGHCGCVSGDCNRLYDDEATCRAAHAECLPSSECTAQDARSSGDDCISFDGYAFNGTECELINCGCSGTECDEVSMSLGECEQRFRACLDPAPTCTEDVFPLVDEDPALSPAYPEFTFEVVERPELFDEETGEVTIFADWTPAQWLGADDLAEPSTCPGVSDEETTVCPYIREFSLSVDGEPVHMLAQLKWDQVVLPPANADVELRIQRHPRGTLSFSVRDPQTMMPLLMIVQAGEALELEDSWEFPPFTFRPGTTVCQAHSAECNWAFLAQSLQVEVDGSWHNVIPPLGVGVIPAETVGGDLDYQASHSSFYVQTFVANTICSAVYAPRQSFAFSSVAER